MKLNVFVQYLSVRRSSVLYVELQSLQSLFLLDEVRGVQSDVLMEDLKVLTKTRQGEWGMISNTNCTALNFLISIYSSWLAVHVFLIFLFMLLLAMCTKTPRQMTFFVEAYSAISLILILTRSADMLRQVFMSDTPALHDIKPSKKTNCSQLQYVNTTTYSHKCSLVQNCLFAPYMCS